VSNKLATQTSLASRRLIQDISERRAYSKRDQVYKQKRPSTYLARERLIQDISERRGRGSRGASISERRAPPPPPPPLWKVSALIHHYESSLKSTFENLSAWPWWNPAWRGRGAHELQTCPRRWTPPEENSWQRPWENSPCCHDPPRPRARESPLAHMQQALPVLASSLFAPPQGPRQHRPFPPCPPCLPRQGLGSLPFQSRPRGRLLRRRVLRAQVH